MCAAPQSDLGSPLPRLEDQRLVTGKARFTPNRSTPGVLHCVFVRSSLAHGVLKAVDLEEVLTQPGVVAAYSASDLDLADIPGRTDPSAAPAPDMPRPPLARERVRYSGEPVAIVIAETLAEATDAAEYADVDMEPLTVVSGTEKALAGQTALFPEHVDNTADRFHTPVEGPRPRTADWPVRVTVTTRNQRLAPMSLEPLGVLAEPRDQGGLTLWCGHQAPHRLRDQLASLLGLEQRRVRIVVDDVGGGFGMRGMLFPEYVVVAAATLRLGRAVRWVETRSEHFLGGTHGRAMEHRVTLAGETSGRVRAAEIEILAEVGAYPHNGLDKPGFAAYMAGGPYDIAEVGVTTTTLVTNRAPTGSYRGAGRPEAAYAIERAIEAFGHAAGLDSAQVRRANLVTPESMPYRTPTGALYDGGDYPAALEEALRAVDADAVRAEQRRRRDDGGHPLGLGVAMFVERAGGAPHSSEYARVELDSDGRIVARVGTAACGQGHETTWTQVVASVLGLAPDQVRVVAGDTDAVAAGTGSFASRSAQIAGSALHHSSLRLRETLVRCAAKALDVAEDEVRLSEGCAQAAGRSASLVELAAVARDEGIEPAAEEVYSPGAQTFPYGAVAAVTEVDPDTGQVRLRRLVAVDDCGTQLNPLVVEGQVHGSLAQGVAQALFEGVEYDPEGQLLTGTLMDYLAPTAPDLPEFETRRLVTPAPSNPLGAKGAGESGCIGAPPAVVLAVLDALAPYGVTDLDMPLTPERVWRALNRATGDGTRPQ